MKNIYGPHKFPYVRAEMFACDRQIKFVDGQIDALVYELYGLSPDEIKIVKGE